MLAHGFFKANMFLGAGSVMHGMNDQVDIRRFGGLRKLHADHLRHLHLRLPRHHRLPPFYGFWTKDRIIEAAFNKGGAQGWIFGSLSLLGAGITAFYMTRLMAMTFFGQKRWDRGDPPPARVASVMTVPMIVLAILSLVGGYLLIYHGAVADFLAPDLGPTVDKTTPIDPQVLSVVIVVVVAIGVLLSWTVLRPPHRSGRSPDRGQSGHHGRPAQPLQRRHQRGAADASRSVPHPVLVYFDARGVDGRVNGLAAALGGSSSRSRRMQTGFVRSYALLDARRRSRCCHRAAAGEGRMSTVPWLTIVGAVPLAGAVIVAALPRDRSPEEVVEREREYALATSGPEIAAAMAEYDALHGTTGVDHESISDLDEFDSPDKDGRPVTDRRKAQDLLAKQVALAVSLITLGIAVAMSLQFKNNGGFQFVQTYDWVRQFGAHYSVGVDGIALVMHRR